MNKLKWALLGLVLLVVPLPFCGLKDPRGTDEVAPRQASIETPLHGSALVAPEDSAGRGMPDDVRPSHLKVLVVDCTGAPVDGVMAQLGFSGGDPLDARTGSDGVCEFALPIVLDPALDYCDLNLRGIAGRLIECAVTLPAPVPDLVEIALSDKPNTLTGIVTHDGRPARDIQIAAIPDSVWRRLRSEHEQVLMHPEVHWAATNATGRFVLCGLPPEAHWLAVGGAGLCRTQGLLPVDPTRQSGLLRIDVDRVFFARAKLCSSDGEALRLAPQATDYCVQLTPDPPDGLRTVHPSWMHLVLAGYSWTNVLRQRDTVTAFFVDTSHERLGSAEILGTAWACGYLRTLVHLPLHDLESGAATEMVRLPALADEYGELAIEIRSPPQCSTLPTGMSQPGVRVRMSPATMRREHFEFVLESASSGPHVITELPRGEYVVRVEYPGITLKALGADEQVHHVEIGSVQESLVLNAGLAGCLLLEPTDPSGAPVDGRLEVRLYRNDARPGAFRLVAFSSPPYRVSGMAAGPATLRVDQPGIGRSGLLPAIVPPGGEVALSIPMQPWR